MRFRKNKEIDKLDALRTTIEYPKEPDYWSSFLYDIKEILKEHGCIPYGVSLEWESGANTSATVGHPCALRYFHWEISHATRIKGRFCHAVAEFQLDVSKPIREELERLAKEVESWESDCRWPMIEQDRAEMAAEMAAEAT